MGLAVSSNDKLFLMEFSLLIIIVRPLSIKESAADSCNDCADDIYSQRLQESNAMAKSRNALYVSRAKSCATMACHES